MNTFIFTANHLSHCIISTEYWKFSNSLSFSLSQQEMFDILVSPHFTLFCKVKVKEIWWKKAKCVLIFVSRLRPHISAFSKKNSEAMILFWSQNRDSSHLINFFRTNAAPPLLLCETNGRNPRPTIKYPSISFLKGRKSQQMKNSRTVLYQRSTCA